MLRRLTLDETLETLGDPRPHMNEDGTIGPGWESEILGFARLPAPLRLCYDPARTVTRFRCHRLLIPLFEAALSEAHADAAVWAAIGDFGGCYCFRRRRRAAPGETELAALSAHAWAAAVDLDVRDNPMGAAGTARSGAEPRASGPSVHSRFPDIMARHGLLWGGTFPRRWRDAMHTEFAGLAFLKAGRR